MTITTNSTPASTIGEVKAFIENYTKAVELPSGAKIERMDLKHNDVWALRQLVDGAATHEQQLVDAAREVIRTELFFQDHPQKFAAQQALRAALAAIGSAA